MSDLDKTQARLAVFGLSMKYGVHMISGPKTVEACGIYVHVDDIEKWQAFEKESAKLFEKLKPTKESRGE